MVSFGLLAAEIDIPLAAAAAEAAAANKRHHFALETVFCYAVGHLSCR